MFKSILSLTLAVAALQASATPISSRANSVTCKTIATGALMLAPENNDGPELPVSLLGGRFKHSDYNGDKSSTLLTKNDDGSAVLADQFEFAECDSSYMGYEQSDDTKYGVLRPLGATKHCVTASAGTLTGAAQKQQWTDSICPTEDSFLQLWSYFSFAPSSGYLNFLERKADDTDAPNHQIVASPVKHGQVQLVTFDSTPKDATAYQFKLALQ